MDRDPLIIETSRGLFCPSGDFYIDAWQGVPRNIVTHAHSDHARRGSGHYLATRQSAPLLRKRLGDDIALDAVEYGETLDLNGLRISLHPAGHVLGSAQVRIEAGGEAWVVSGDYKRQADPTCQPFELLRCDTFVTECTFGLPIFRWSDLDEVRQDINRWWRNNVELGRTSILLAYSLGKAQRVLAGLDGEIGPILLHGAVEAMTRIYRESGIPLPQTQYASVENARLHRGRALVIAPPSALKSTWSRKFAPFSVGIASGWMRVRGIRRRRGADRGFVLSDHVDFPGLLATIAETGAEHVVATHGYTDALVALARERGLQSSAFHTRFGGEEEETDIATEEPAQDDSDAIEPPPTETEAGES